jgi:endoglucanase
MMNRLVLAALLCTAVCLSDAAAQQYIRVNQLGYQPAKTKNAVWCAKNAGGVPSQFLVIDAKSRKVVWQGKASKDFGAYGPFSQTCRLDFSGFRQTGRFFLRAGDAESPVFQIAADVYDKAPDFALRYMRQQRCGYNPFLRDSCHTHDGYTMYGPMPDSTHVDVTGGWHDASDYLQYVTTSANAAYHLLAAWRDFPQLFSDAHLAQGIPGQNGIADVLDEARWGLDWLLKMHPRDDWMFNQIADDRDHVNMRIPKEDPFYGKGFERPVYFCTGQPQGSRQAQKPRHRHGLYGGQVRLRFRPGRHPVGNTRRGIRPIVAPTRPLCFRFWFGQTRRLPDGPQSRALFL